jgi:hypothetical protein
LIGKSANPAFWADNGVIGHGGATLASYRVIEEIVEGFLAGLEAFTSAQSAQGG